ncbi:MAG: putative ABC exporter domain-containing protein [Myxococcota bacterium]
MRGLLDRLMGRPLRRLLELRVGAAVRSSIARLRRPSGWVVLLFVLPLWGGALVSHLQESSLRGFYVGTLDDIGPAVMALGWLAMLVLRGGGEQIGFLPAEVDQLFAAPLTPSQLIRYKLALLSVTWFVMGLLIGPMASLYSRHFLGGMLAVWLLFPALQLTSMITALVLERQHRPWTNLALLAALLGLCALAFGASPEAVSKVGDVLAGVEQNVVGQVLLAPFAAASTLFVSESITELLGATALLTVANLTQAGVVLALGRRTWFEQAASGAAQRTSMVEQYRSGGLGMAGGLWRVSVPRLPRLGGVGPVAWRRLLELARRPLVLLGLGGPVLMSLAVVVGLTTFSEVHPDAIFMMAMLAPLWCLWIIPSNLRFDFRSDLDRMDQLLALPIAPMAVVIGQILPVAVLFVLSSWVAILGLLAWKPEHAFWCLALGLALPPVTVFSLAIENWLFLLLPVRIETGEAALGSVGRNLIGVFGAYAINLLVVGVGVGFAWVVGLLSGSRLLGAGLGALGMSIAALIVLWLAARQFRAFDPSRHVPT